MRFVAVLLAATAATPAFADPLDDRVDGFTAALPLIPKDAAAVSARCDAGLTLLQLLQADLAARTGPARVDSDFAAHDRINRLGNAIYGENDLVGATNADKAIRDAAIACTTRLSAADSGYYLSRPVYHRLNAIPLDSVPPDLRYAFDRELESFRLSGVELDDATRAKVQALDKEIADIGATFGRNIAEKQGRITVDPARLKGLPEDWLASHLPGEDGLVVVTTAYPDIIPIMTLADDRETRRKAALAFLDIAWPDNLAVLQQLIAKRSERAALLGYDSHARLSMKSRMIQSPERAWEFIDELERVSRDGAAAERAQLTAYAKTFDPSIEQLEFHDVSYFTNKLKRERYDVDKAELRKYFTTDASRQGIFELVTRLFGAQFTPWDTPVWDDDVTAWEMREDGKVIGRFFLDLYPREGKYTHAAQFSARSGHEGGDLPVAALITNFSQEGQMDHDEFVTFLHEFGHLIHKMYADHQPFVLQSRGALPGDFGEAPSTFLEEWAYDYPTLATFAKDRDGNAIPRELVDKLNASRRLGRAQALRFGLGLSAAALHFYESPTPNDLYATFVDDMGKYGGVPLKEGHFLGSWGHLDGYSSNYYTYNWSEAIALDLFTRFRKAGMGDVATAHAYRDEILRSGGKRSPDAMIEAFLGRPFGLDAVRAYLAPAEPDQSH